MGEKILPLGKSPITCYPNHAHVFSIIDAYSKEYLPWLYNYYVQLVVPKDLKLGVRVDFATPHITRSVPWLEKGRIDKDTVLKHWTSFSEFVKECIDKNQYVYSLLDVGKINIYNKINFSPHDPLIYGYDDEKKIFYIKDNLQNGKYDMAAVSFVEIEDAVNSFLDSDAIDWIPGIYFFSYRTLYDYGTCRFKNHYRYDFNIILYKKLLKDYLEERNSINHWDLKSIFIDKESENDNAWGLGVYGIILEFIRFINEGHSADFGGEFPLDSRGVYVLLEQKMIMFNSFKYMCESNMIKADTLYEKELEMICKKYLLIINYYKELEIYLKNVRIL